MGKIEYQLVKEQEKKWYAIYAGSINGAELKDVVFCTEEEANVIAHEYACEDYDTYAGLHGLRDIYQIMEEDEIEDEDDAWSVYVEERESWLDYNIRDIEIEIDENHYHYDKIKELVAFKVNKG